MTAAATAFAMSISTTTAQLSARSAHVMAPSACVSMRGPKSANIQSRHMATEESSNPLTYDDLRLEHCHLEGLNRYAPGGGTGFFFRKSPAGNAATLK